MNNNQRPTIVVLGMMTKMAVAGVIWQTVHYLVGLKRLGFEVYYAEDHGMNPSMFTESEDDNGAAKAAAFIARVMERFQLGPRWSYRAWHDDGRYYGIGEARLNYLFKTSAAVINLHGGTMPREAHRGSGPFIYIGTDPVLLEIELHEQKTASEEFLDAHDAYFTFGENLGAPDCKLPLPPARYKFHPTRQPVIMDFWQPYRTGAGECFTTIGNWLQPWRDITFQGETYHWSKHYEFLKFIDLPQRSPQPFELALSSYEPSDRAMLKEKGWRIRHALDLSTDLDDYRHYIAQSRGEWTVAKDQNVRLRSGWFSDRSATYLAAGRPVITQETGFSNVLPSGAGLFGFATMDDVLEATAQINGDYQRHTHAAAEIAREYFSYDVVLPRLLEQAGVSVPKRTLVRQTSPNAQLEKGNRKQQQLALSDIAPQIPLVNGVNVIGYLRTESGVGEAARGYVRVLQAADISVSLRDVSDLCGNRGEDDSVPLPEKEAAYDVNLVCVDIDKHFGVLARYGEEFFAGRYNIGVWAWETQDFPKKWFDRFAYYDEIWVGSSFIQENLAPISPVPVLRVPPVLSAAPHGSREAGRKHLKVDADEFVFLFIFDANSTFRRKNPLGIIEAFRLAFQPNDNVRLVLKSVNAERYPDEFEHVKARAAGLPITIADGYWSAEEMRDLMAACDAYVSLHRSEGTGLTIADAMAAGKPVIATGWSGNMDFMTTGNSFPVRYELIGIEPDSSGPYRRATGQWAEASLEHAAELMRHVREDAKDATRRGSQARADLERQFSTSALARLVQQRLRAIALRRRFTEFQTLMKRPYSDYVETVQRIRAIVAQKLPHEARIAVASRGDDQLLTLAGRQGLHFPQTRGGVYAGSHPADSTVATKELERLRAEGAQYFLVPKTMFWMFDSYPEFTQQLERRYSTIVSDDSCSIFELAGQSHRKSLLHESSKIETVIQRLPLIREQTERALTRGAAAINVLREETAQHQRKVAELEAKLREASKPVFTAPAPPPTPASPIQEKREAYLHAIEAIRSSVRNQLPLNATIAVITRGDSALLHYEGRRAWHFPQTREGQWAGQHPKDDATAVSHLTELRKAGAEFFILPAIYFWWLDFYKGFAQHLATEYKLLSRDEFSAIYDLREPASERREADAGAAQTDYRALVERLRHRLVEAIPVSATIAIVSKGDPNLLNLEGRRAWHFPRTPEGEYAGRHPADSAAAISHLQALVEGGLGYLVLPTPYHWWLEFYRDLNIYLTNNTLVLYQDADAIVYDVRRPVTQTVLKQETPAPFWRRWFHRSAREGATA